MKEKIKEALEELGFNISEDEEGIIFSFSYEARTYLLIYNEKKDEDFLTVALPCVYDLEEGEEKDMKVYRMMEGINSNFKYIKSYLVNDSVWMVYEREFIGEEDLPTTISHMVTHLEAAFLFIMDSTKSTDDEETDIISDAEIISESENSNETETSTDENNK